MSSPPHHQNDDAREGTFPAPPPPSHRGPLGRLVLGLAGATLVLLTVELGLRAWLGSPDGGPEIYEVLGDRVSYLTRDGDWMRAGWTSAGDLALAPLPCHPDETQILVLGGSSVRGGTLGVPPREEFPGVLGAELQLPVRNLGFPGFESADLAQILEEFGDCRADAVIVYAGHNDLGNLHFHRSYGDRAAKTRLKTQTFLEQFQIYVQLSQVLSPRQEGTMASGEEPPERALAGKGGKAGKAGRGRKRGKSEEIEGARAFEAHPSITDTQRAKISARFRAQVDRIVALAAAHDRQLLLVGAVHRFTDVPPTDDCDTPPCAAAVHAEGSGLIGKDPVRAAELLIEAWDAEAHIPRATSDLRQVMVDAAGAADHVVYIDAMTGLPLEAEVPVPADRLFSDGLHFSRAGHRELALLLAPIVRERLEVEE